MADQIADIDTRTFDEWLRDYVSDAEAVVRTSHTTDRTVYRRGLLDAAREVLTRYEQTYPSPAPARRADTPAA